MQCVIVSVVYCDECITVCYSECVENKQIYRDGQSVNLSLADSHFSGELTTKGNIETLTE